MVGVHGHEFIPTGTRIHPDEILRIFGLYRNQRRSIAARCVSKWGERIGRSDRLDSRVSRDLFSHRVKIVGHIAANGVVADCFFFSLSLPLFPSSSIPSSFFFAVASARLFHSRGTKRWKQKRLAVCRQR